MRKRKYNVLERNFSSFAPLCQVIRIHCFPAWFARTAQHFLILLWWRRRPAIIMEVLKNAILSSNPWSSEMDGICTWSSPRINRLLGRFQEKLARLMVQTTLNIPSLKSPGFQLYEKCCGFSCQFGSNKPSWNTIYVLLHCSWSLECLILNRQDENLGKVFRLKIKCCHLSSASSLSANFLKDSLVSAAAGEYRYGWQSNGFFSQGQKQINFSKEQHPLR